MPHSHATSKILWHEMLPDELLEAIRTRRVCYMAFGLAEPHGPYNALGLDHLKAQGICELAAKAHGGVVAPPFCWHIQERPEFPWMQQHGVVNGGLCSSIPTELFFRLAMFTLRAIDARGFDAAILITGHYGGVERDLRLVCDYYLRRTNSPLRVHSIADWEVIDESSPYRGDHAGITETSQLMYLRPDLVDLTRKKDGWPTGGWCGVQFPTNGVMPSREIGEAIVQSQVKNLGEAQRRLLTEHRPRAGWRAPNLNETDAIWKRCWEKSAQYFVCSTTLEQYYAGGPPTFPGWAALDA